MKLKVVQLVKKPHDFYGTRKIHLYN